MLTSEGIFVFADYNDRLSLRDRGDVIKIIDDHRLLELLDNHIKSI
jgi:hypothetical protein